MAKRIWFGGAIVVVVAIALLAYGAASWDWFGHTRGAGVIQGAAIEQGAITAREAWQGAAAQALGGDGDDRILFGDLHVHTTFSADAFLWSLPILGGEGVHPLADACDFARYCSGLDFFASTDHAESITPVRWRETQASLRQCNAIAGDPAQPDLSAFIGFEWTQTGDTPETHYGHKNVIFEGLNDGDFSARAIAASAASALTRRTGQANLNKWVPFLDWRHAQVYFDLQHFNRETAAVPPCDPEAPSDQLPATCTEEAATPGELTERLDAQGLDYLLIPHGTTWGFATPPGVSFDKQLRAPQHPERQTLIEVMSGHGNSEEFRNWRELTFAADGQAQCPPPQGNYEPACWRAGEIIRERCTAAGESAEACDARAAETRQRAASLGIGYHLAVAGESPSDWLEAGQCRDCFVPSFSYRPRTSVQYGLAIANFDDPLHPRRFHWGFIGSSDNHRARPGTGYKPIDRYRQTEVAGPINDEWRTRFTEHPQPPAATPTDMTRAGLASVAALQIREAERQASFLTTGALAAVHTKGRTREQIYDALRRREVYATSGPRILLWFDLLNAPGGGAAPMGSEVSMTSAPRFRVRAAGDFKQAPGCPDFAERGMSAARLQHLCGGECYNPTNERLRITRIEIIRIRPQARPDEDVAGLIEDVWRSFPCNDAGQGCVVEFSDPEFVQGRRDTLYYARAVQEPTPRINGANLRPTRDDQGRTVSVDPCWGDYRTPRSDNCLAPVEERAWASPIYVNARR